MENSGFLNEVEKRKHKLKRWLVRPSALAKAVRDPEAWQGWRIVRKKDSADNFLKKTFRHGDWFILDFGEEFVGRLKLKLATAPNYNDAPVRLRLIFAEFPLEIGERSRKYGSALAESWLQEEIVTLDDLPQTYTLPRVYAMRYLYVEVIGAPEKLLFQDIAFEAQSAVRKFIPPPETFDAEAVELDRAAQRTLRNCLQEVVLDGPKRDRRLWLGDLRLEAQVNAVTFRNFDLIERCIYLLAAFPLENGQIPACIFDKPRPYGTKCAISDYSFLFADLLLFHYQQTGNLALLKDMYALAVQQFAIFRPFYRNGIAEQELPGWNFIDWCELDRRTASEGTYILGLRALAEIAGMLGHKADQKNFRQEAAYLSSQLREHAFERRKGLFTSGPKGEISYASQIWMILADVVSASEAKEILGRLEQTPEAIRPVTPYLHHHLLSAYEHAGEKDKLDCHLRAYWGEMLRKGMNVFPEVFVPENERLTPYGTDPRINSACHGWSCAPAYFLRKG